MSAWSGKTRRAPSRPWKDGRIYGHTPTAMQDIEYTPPSENGVKMRGSPPAATLVVGQSLRSAPREARIRCKILPAKSSSMPAGSRTHTDPISSPPHQPPLHHKPVPTLLLLLLLLLLLPLLLVVCMLPWSKRNDFGPLRLRVEHLEISGFRSFRGSSQKTSGRPFFVRTYNAHDTCPACFSCGHAFVPCRRAPVTTRLALVVASPTNNILSAVLSELSLLGLQSRCGDKALKVLVVCPRNGTLVLKALIARAVLRIMPTAEGGTVPRFGRAGVFLRVKPQ